MQQHQPGLQTTPHAVQMPQQAVQWQVAAPPVELPPDTQTSPKQRTGAPLRLVTGIIHLCLGFVLITCGVVVLSVHFPEPGYDTYTRMPVEGIDRRDRQVWPVWFGAVAMFNAALGMISRRNQVVISRYMAFSIVSSVAAFIVMVPVSVQVGTSNRLRLELLEPLDGRADYNNPCSHTRGRYDSYGSGFDIPAQEMICIEETLSTAKLHMVFHCVMLIYLVVEFFVAILSAISTCFGLDCCTTSPRGEQVLYYQAQIPQFQSPVVVVNPNEPPPAYTSLLTSALNQSPSSPAAVGVHSSGQPQQVAFPSPAPQSAGETSRTPDARGTPTPSQNPQPDDGLYVTPDAVPDRSPLAAPHSANEYSYANTQYRPAPPAYSNNRFHHEDTQPGEDQHYITVTD